MVADAVLQLVEAGRARLDDCRPSPPGAGRCSAATAGRVRTCGLSAWPVEVFRAQRARQVATAPAG